ncbi:MAG: glycosyltransferase 87 family protein [Corynebacterium sp.]|uniref:glycosyltransferase 87 family protein n=1 Tax=Corynebacterium sp. TaxID=1720 RepID=UPI0026DC5C10|nr:glycosyltransferase 87 family protein [Corynebacterium sp.]MDO5097895.1 glycosyltransferase 87 family protein [Corynebacterium sp.]
MSLISRIAADRWTAAIGAVCGVLIVAVMLVDAPTGAFRYLVDLDVYRLGATEFLRSGDIYNQRYLTQEAPLPFTYPPFAALVFSPLAYLPLPVGSIIFTAVTLICLVVSCAVALAWCAVPHPLVWALRAAPLVMLCEPVIATLMFGQINTVLLLLVLVDASGVLRKKLPWWPPGVLCGIAAAIKLTPAIFIVYFLLNAEWKAARNFVLSALIASALPALMYPQLVWQYFSHTIFSTDRIGASHFAANQSIAGVISRAEIPAGWWLPLSIVAIAGGGYSAYRAIRSNQPLLALSVVALIGLLASPISWSHHWVWLPLTSYALWRAGARIMAGWVLFAATIGCFHAFLPSRNHVELEWSVVQQILGSHYVIVAGAVLVWCAYRLRTNYAASQRQGTPIPTTAEYLAADHTPTRSGPADPHQ